MPPPPLGGVLRAPPLVRVALPARLHVPGLLPLALALRPRAPNNTDGSVAGRRAMTIPTPETLTLTLTLTRRTTSVADATCRRRRVATAAAAAWCSLLRWWLTPRVGGLAAAAVWPGAWAGSRRRRCLGQHGVC